MHSKRTLAKRGFLITRKIAEIYSKIFLRSQFAAFYPYGEGEPYDISANMLIEKRCLSNYIAFATIAMKPGMEHEVMGDLRIVSTEK